MFPGWQEYINKTAVQQASVNVIKAVAEDFTIPLIVVAGTPLRVMSFCSKCVGGWVTKRPPQVDEAIVKGMCNANVIETAPALLASEVSRAKLNEALSQNNPIKFKELLLMVADIEQLDAQAVSMTLICCLSSMSKSCAPHLKNICMGLISAI